MREAFGRTCRHPTHRTVDRIFIRHNFLALMSIMPTMNSTSLRVLFFLKLTLESAAQSTWLPATNLMPRGELEYCWRHTSRPQRTALCFINS